MIVFIIFNCYITLLYIFICETEARDIVNICE